MFTPDDDAVSGEAGYDARELARLVGPVHGELMRRILPLVRLSAEEREERGLEGLAELRAHDMLTDAEVGQLTTLLRSLGDDGVTPHEQARRAAEIDQELTSTSAGVVAVAIAGVASDSTRAVVDLMDGQPEGANVEITTWPQADVVGGIVGATGGLAAGLTGGGPAAVLYGAAGGAAAGSVAFLVAQELLS